jgi:predicted nucleotidyltransferase
MTALSPEQIASLRELQKACERLGVDAVLIGAIAFRIGMADRSRHTEDVDVALAIDLDDLPRLTSLLQEYRWKQDPRREHRWRTSAGARFDLIPAGAKLRQARQLEWPVSKMRMSLAGFEHVFADAVEFQIAEGLRAKVAPLGVLTLLKMAAYMDSPYERQKDLQDVAVILARYEPEDSRRFSDEVIEARLDYEAVGAYCMGQDLQRLCSVEERGLVERFMAQFNDEHTNAYHLFARQMAPGRDDDVGPQVRMLTTAFMLGFRVRQ